jgi:S1-C subfamily serine protease
VAAALLVGAVMLAGVAGCGGDSDDGGGASSKASKASGSSGSGKDSDGDAGTDELQENYQETIAEVLPSVVQITAATDLGSGIVYDKKGHIITNAHVVGKAKTFEVTLANSKEVLEAKLVYSYPAEDLAVIKLTEPRELKPAEFADSEKVAVGQVVLAMGNPLGYSSSVTQGIVSGLGRTIAEPGSNGSPNVVFADMVQTSAAINPGNSGGALVNLDNKVIGINTLAATDPELGNSAAPGIGFAIPSSTVTGIADQIVKDGKVSRSGRAALGVQVRTVLDARFDPEGAGVVEVKAGGPAAEAGLKPEDVIVRLADEDIFSADDLTRQLADLKPGQKVELEYLRGDSKKAHTTEVRLGEL